MGEDMTDETKWFWWASTDEENYHIGPCNTRDEVIETAINDELGMDDVDGRWVSRFWITEAQQHPVMLSEFIDVDRMVECADEDFFDSDLVGDGQDAPFFKTTMDQDADLIARIKTACDEWQAAHNLVFKPWAFTAQRHGEWITRDCGPVEVEDENAQD
jgi:hypothetical protein